MANGTTQPPRQEDERDVARRQFEDLTNRTYKPGGADQAGASQADQLRQQDQSAVDAAEQITREAAEEQARTLEESPTVPSEQIPYTPSNKPTKAKGASFNTRRNQIMVAIGIATFVGTGIFGIFSSIINLPKLALENPAAKISRAVMSRRVQKLSGRYFEVKSCTGVAIVCRMSRGVSDKEIAAFKEAGILEDSGIAKDNKGRSYIDHFVTKDESGASIKVTRDNFGDVFKSNPGFKDSVTTFSNASAILARSSQTLKLTVGKAHAKLNALFKPGVSDKERRSIWNKYFFSGRGDPRFKTGNEKADKKAEEEAQKAATDGPGVVDETDSLTGPLDEALVGGTSFLKKLGTGAQGVFGYLTTGCQAFEVIRKVVIGAKIVKMLALAAFTLRFFTDFQAVAAGHGDIGTLGFEIGLLMVPSTLAASKGKTWFNGPFLQWISQGSVDDSNNVARYAIAGPRLKGFQEAGAYFKSAGINTELCGKVDSSIAQITFLTLGLVTAIYTGGASAVAGFAGQVALGFAVSFALNYATAWLIKFVAGTIVPGLNDPGGGFAISQAMFAGLGALNMLQGRAVGFRPLKSAQLAETAIDIQPEIASLDAMDHLHKNPFSLNEPDSIPSKLAYAIAPYVAAPVSSSTFQNMASIITSPFNLVASSAGSLVMGRAHAAATLTEQLKGDYSNDPDYKELGLQTDATGALVYALTPDEITMDPTETDQYMYDHGHVDADGAPKSQDFKDYVEVCTHDVIPPIPGGGGIEVADNVDTNQCFSDDQKFKEFRSYITNSTYFKSAGQSLDGTLGTTLESGL